MRSIIRKMPFLGDGRVLLGVIFVIAGLFVAREGILKLRDIWQQFAPFFPLSLPDDVSQRAIHSVPDIFKFFVVLVSSVCAILIGALWAVSGVQDLFQARRKIPRPPDFEKPELVAESIRSGRTLYWTSTPRLMRSLWKLWSPARFMSPISYQFLKESAPVISQDCLTCGPDCSDIFFPEGHACLAGKVLPHQPQSSCAVSRPAVFSSWAGCIHQLLNPCESCPFQEGGVHAELRGGARERQR